MSEFSLKSFNVSQLYPHQNVDSKLIISNMRTESENSTMLIGERFQVLKKRQDFKDKATKIIQQAQE